MDGDHWGKCNDKEEGLGAKQNNLLLNFKTKIKCAEIPKRWPLVASIDLKLKAKAEI